MGVPSSLGGRRLPSTVGPCVSFQGGVPRELPVLVCSVWCVVRVAREHVPTLVHLGFETSRV